MKKQIFIIVLLFVSFIGESISQQEYTFGILPDTLIIKLHETWGCFTDHHKYITILCNKENGNIYIYSKSLKIDTLNQTEIAEFLRLFEKYDINSINKDQFDPAKPVSTTADGSGTFCYLINKKEEQNKIEYPIPKYRIRNKNYLKFIYEFDSLSSKFTREPTLEELLKLYNDRNDMFDIIDPRVIETEFNNRISNLQNKIITELLQDLFNKGICIDGIIDLFYNKEHHYLFTDFIIENFDHLLNSKNFSRKYYLPKIISYWTNDSLKIAYLKKCLRSNDNNVRYKAAKYLFINDDLSGKQVFLDNLSNSSNQNIIITSLEYLTKFNDEKMVIEIYKNYIQFLEHNRVAKYPQDTLVCHYLLSLNKIMKINDKKDKELSYFNDNKALEMKAIEKIMNEFTDNE